MNELGNQGRTILFVSHNINSILSLCNKGLLLEKAHLKFFGDVNECINQYIHSCPQAGFKWEGELENHYMSIYKMTLNPPKSNLGFFYQSEKTQINLLFEVKKPCADMTISLTIMNSLQQVVAQSKLSDHQHQEMMNKKGLHELSFNLDLNLFHPGEYQIKLEHFLSHQKHHFHEDIILSFVISQQQIKPKLEFGISKEGLSLGNQWEIPKKNLKPAEEYLLFR